MMSSLDLQFNLVLGATVLLGVGWLTAGGLQRASAAARHLAWTVAVISVLVLPLAHWLVPAVDLEGMPSVDLGSWRMSPVGVARSNLPPSDAPGKSGGSGAAIEAISDSRNDPASNTALDASGSIGTRGARSASRPLPDVGWMNSAPALSWLVGAALVLGLLGRERWRLRRLFRGSRRARTGRLRAETDRLAKRLGVRRRVSVHVGGSAALPMTSGSFRPSILLPSGAGAWPDARLRSVLLHELAHVRRRDVLTQSLAAAACVLYWFNPLAWLAAKRMREERERAADDLVLLAGVSGPNYARVLVEMARGLRETPSLLASASMARPSSLPDRIAAILDDSHYRREPGSTAVAVALGVSLSIVGLLAAFTPAPGGSLSSTPRQAIGADTLPACWRGDSNRRLSVNETESYREVVREDDRCRATVRITGRLEFDADYSNVVGLSRGGEVVVEERTVSGSRRFEVRRGADGALEYEYRVNEEPSVTGEAAETAFRSRLLVLFRYGGAAATARASWMLASGGVERVLAEARAIPPDPFAAEYLLTALQAPQPSPGDVAEVANIVGELVGSDAAAGQVLSTLLVDHPEVVFRSQSARDVVARAMASVGSDAVHADMLLAAARSDAAHADVDAMLLESARGEIGSDAVMTRFLVEYARRRPGSAGEDRRGDDFWRAVATVGSDAEHTRLLRQLVVAHGNEPGLLVRALASAEGEIGSDGVLATFLQWTVRRFGDRLSEPGARRAFQDALDEVGDDAVRRRVEATVEASESGGRAGT